MSITDSSVKGAKLAAVSASISELAKEEYEARLGLIQASSISDEKKMSIMHVSIENARQRIEYLEKQYKAIELE